MTIRKKKDLGELHQLLLKACVPDAKGNVSITVLAQNQGISASACYKWIEDEKIPPQRVKKLVDQMTNYCIETGVKTVPVRIRDFDNFVYV